MNCILQIGKPFPAFSDNSFFNQSGFYSLEAFLMVVGSLPPHMILPNKHGIANYMTDCSVLRTFRRDIKLCCMKRQKKLPSKNLHHEHGYGAASRVFVLSDLHTDYPENMAWVKCLSTVKYRGDILLVAGDVAETYKNFVLTMSELKDRFQSIFYVPGNHDLWCRLDGENYVRISLPFQFS